MPNNKPKCINPYCTSKAVPGNNLGMCWRCDQQAKFMVWMLPQILDIKEKPKIVVEEKKEVSIWTPDSGPSGMIR